MHKIYNSQVFFKTDTNLGRRTLKQKKENDEENIECLLKTVPENKGVYIYI